MTRMVASLSRRDWDWGVFAVCLILAASPARAQRVNSVEAQPGAPAQGRALERQFRERFAEVVKRRLNLNETQMQQLGRVNDRFERDRMQLLRDERRARQALRAEVLAGDSADQKKVAGLLDELLTIQRRRLDLAESEQRELATFMAPTQRAKYFAIQDELRKRLENLRRQRQERRAGAGFGGQRPLP
jgi:Spy/CpxP family protein refolding chaperone